MKKQIHASRFTFYVSLLLLLVLLTACGRADDETPTPGLNLTQVYETVMAEVTSIAAQTIAPTDVIPTESGFPTLTPTLAVTATPDIPTAVASTFTPTATPEPGTCDRAEAAFPIDITVPDDTEFNPGTTFVKTWRLVNIGTCTWTSGYSLVFFSGEKMNGPDVAPLGAEVAPGQVVDISVNLTAPSEPGTYQGNWMLKNPSGVLFGVGPQFNSFFWVKIIVRGGAGTPTITLTPDGSATATSTAPTLTPTQPGGTVILVNTSIAFQPDGFVDLDTGTTNGASGNDITYTTDGSGTHPITPISGATMAVFGGQEPTYAQCQSAGLSGAALTAESLSAGTFLCYRTEQGNYGWLRIDGFDTSSFLLSVTLLTWD